ncbi:MAG: hypothetical protein CBC09_08355 [Cellvibrionales bacterium TMED49]|jgi:hypothetical protein|nr:MAG: hypothetical protein CBC09_08355 [Cellvibrionales bacterium TMED49]|tara:strand:+ start:819 stop:1301 length:483 start_codon:yes stop_codon:yes gene_type:complete
MTDQQKANNEQNRTSRSADTRAKKDARKPWSPPTMLDTPPAPDGYTYRWIRAEVVGQEDRKNVTSRLREGFDLVRAEELDGFEIPSLDDGKHAGVVSVGGLLLAKIPNETREERNSYFEQRAQTQQDAVDNDLMRESDPSSPILKPERKSSVTFGGGSRE